MNTTVESNMSLAANIKYTGNIQFTFLKVSQNAGDDSPAIQHKPVV